MMDVREKLVELSDIQVLQREIECVKRKSSTNCTDCFNCDLLMPDERILTAYKNAIDALQNEQGVTVQEWIPVTDRLPEQPPNRVDEQGRSWVTQNIDCIVYDGKIVFVAHYSFQNKFFWYSDTLHPLKNITHWMEIPQPPKGE